jgi:hypothetical protein
MVVDLDLCLPAAVAPMNGISRIDGHRYYPARPAITEWMACMILVLAVS